MSGNGKYFMSLLCLQRRGSLKELDCDAILLRAANELLARQGFAKGLYNLTLSHAEISLTSGLLVDRLENRNSEGSSIALACTAGISVIMLLSRSVVTVAVWRSAKLWESELRKWSRPKTASVPALLLGLLRMYADDLDQCVEFWGPFFDVGYPHGGGSNRDKMQRLLSQDYSTMQSKIFVRYREIDYEIGMDRRSLTALYVNVLKERLNRLISPLMMDCEVEYHSSVVEKISRCGMTILNVLKEIPVPELAVDDILLFISLYLWSGSRTDAKYLLKTYLSGPFHNDKPADWRLLYWLSYFHLKDEEFDLCYNLCVEIDRQPGPHLCVRYLEIYATASLLKSNGVPDSQRAFELYLKILSIDPDHIRAAYQSGQCLEQYLNQTRRSLEFYTRVRNSNISPTRISNESNKLKNYLRRNFDPFNPIWTNCFSASEIKQYILWSSLSICTIKLQWNNYDHIQNTLQLAKETLLQQPSDLNAHIIYASALFQDNQFNAAIASLSLITQKSPPTG